MHDEFRTHGPESAVDDEMPPRPTWQDCAKVLDAFLSSGDATRSDFGCSYTGLAYEIIGSGLITREEVKKPCRTCGTPRHDFSYWKVTAAGRMLVAAWRETQAKGEGN